MPRRPPPPGLQVLRRAKLIGGGGGGGFAVSSAIVIFVHIASEEGDDPDGVIVPPFLDDGFTIDDANKQMEYEEFVEGMATVAEAVLPGGRGARNRRPLDVLLEDLIDKYLIPNVKELRMGPSKVPTLKEQNTPPFEHATFERISRSL